ncbi:MAG: GrpB family protein [Bacteroidota bacterium]
MSRAKLITVVPYNPAWPMMYQKEASLIEKALDNNLLAIHHIGSTSVPGLAAKPKIDILAVVRYPQQAITSLHKIGIEYRGEWNVPFKYGFAKRGDVDVNLHVFEKGNPEIELNLLFCEYLSSHPNVRDTYAACKQSILQDARSHYQQEGTMFATYTIKKASFIRSVLRKAGFDRLRMLLCTDYVEWDSAERLRKKYFTRVGIPPHPILRDKNHHHLILYKGVDIIGYAHVNAPDSQQRKLVMLLLDNPEYDNKYRCYFQELIAKWMNLHR